MSMWQTLVGTLAMRTPPTLDEIRSEKLAEGRRRTLEAMRAAAATEAARRYAGTEKTIARLVKEKPGITFAGLAEKMGVTEAYVRVVTKRMHDDGRLAMSVSKFGKKHWYAK